MTDTTMTDTTMTDEPVLGGGAAGLSGALTLARSRRSVPVLDAGAHVNADLVVEDTARAVARHGIEGAA